MTPPSARAIEITASDGAALRGQLWAGSQTWAILLHEVGEGEDLDSWRPLIPALVGRGWSVLAVDLRGHGASGGEWDTEWTTPDLQQITAFARSNGAGTVSLIAAGQIALDVLASTGDLTPDAIVLFSPVVEDRGMAPSLRGTGEAKLFICGGADPEQRRSAEELRNASIGWAGLLNLPTTEDGADLLTGDYGSHAREHVVGFLAEQEFVARNRLVRRAER